MARATAEIDQLKLALAQGAQKLQAAETLNLEMAKRLEDKDLLLATASEERDRLQAMVQEGRAYASNLDGQLQDEKAKTALLERTVEQNSAEMQKMKTEIQTFRDQLNALKAKSEAELPERVEALLRLKDQDLLEAKNSTQQLRNKLLLKTSDFNKQLSAATSQRSEWEASANEWAAKCRDLQKLQYHSDQNSRSAAASGSGGPSTIHIEPYNPEVPPPPQPLPTSYWPVGQSNNLTHAARDGVRAPDRQVSAAVSTSALPLGGGSQTRDLSAETRGAVSTMAEEDRPRTKEAESVSFDAWPSINAFRQWRMHFRRTIASSSTKPTVALAWASEIDEVTSVDQFRSSTYTSEGLVVDFETLDTKVAAGLMKITHGDFKKRITKKDEEHQIVHKKMLNGRPIAWLTFQHFKINDMESSMLEFSDLMALELKGDNLRGFDTEWDNVLLGMREHPEEKYLENLYRKQVKKSKQFELLYNQMETDHILRGQPRSYHSLKQMARHNLDRETRDKHLEAKKKHLEKAFVNNGRKQGDRKGWLTKGNCHDIVTCPFNHPPEKRGSLKKQGGGKSRSGKGKGSGSGSGSRSPGSRSKSRSSSRGGQRDVCRDLLQGKCKRDNCRYWHPPPCNDFKEGGCKRDNCKFLHGAAKGNTSRESSAGSNGSRGRSKEKKKPKDKKSKDRSGSSSGGKPKKKKYKE